MVDRDGFADPPGTHEDDRSADRSLLDKREEKIEVGPGTPRPGRRRLSLPPGISAIDAAENVLFIT